MKIRHFELFIWLTSLCKNYSGGIIQICQWVTSRLFRKHPEDCEQNRQLLLKRTGLPKPANRILSDIKNNDNYKK